MLNNYTGEVDPKALRPKHGTSYLEYSELKPIVDLANAWRYGDMQEALKDLRTAESVDQETIHLSYMLEAEVFITHNLFPEALERLTIFLDEYPNDLQARSEEHTSELQSRGHLVCRLLLEKKKKKNNKTTTN